MAARFLTSLFLLSSITLLAQPCQEVIGYFPSWKWYHRKFLVNPATIDYTKYSIINYAFFQPNADGSIRPFDPYADKTLLLGTIKPEAPPGYSRSIDFGHREWHIAETSLVSKAQQAGTKVLISLGGWTLSNHFSSIAADSVKRGRFAASCAQLVRTYQVDGVDIDWEYPGYGPQNGSAADKENFTILVKEIRDSFNVLEKSINKSLLITAAFGVAPSRMAFIEWEKVVPLLDFINLMTYDFYGSNHSRTNHHAPLFPPEQGLNGFDLHSVVNHLTGNYAVPRHKINIGIAFYGRTQKTKGAPNLHTASMQIPDRETFPEDKGNPMFYSIVARQDLFDYYWDPSAQVPFLKGKNLLNTFVTFDDENSIALKAHYIQENGLAGAMVWDITGDHIETNPGSGVIAETPLADVLNKVFCHASLSISNRFQAPGTIGFLSQKSALVKSRTYPPRLSRSLELDKKEMKRLHKLARKEARKKKKEKDKTPDRYFNGGW